MVQRLSPDVPPPPMYIKSGRLAADQNIDRWQVIEYLAPSAIRIHVGGAPAGTGALDGRYEHGLNLWVINAITPETETTSNYYWASVRQHAKRNSCRSVSTKTVGPTRSRPTPEASKRAATSTD